MTSRDRNLWPTARPPDLEHVRPQTLVQGVALARHLLPARQDRLCAFDVQRHRLWLDALHSAVDDLPLLLHVVRIPCISLGFADTLQDNLLGILRRDATEILGSVLDHHRIAHFGVGLNGSRLHQGDLQCDISHFLDHLLLDENASLSGIWINLRRNVLVCVPADVTSIGRHQCHLQGVDYDLAR